MQKHVVAFAKIVDRIRKATTAPVVHICDCAFEVLDQLRTVSMTPCVSVSVDAARDNEAQFIGRFMDSVISFPWFARQAVLGSPWRAKGTRLVGWGAKRSVSYRTRGVWQEWIAATRWRKRNGAACKPPANRFVG
jgi:hypothetical protein